MDPPSNFIHDFITRLDLSVSITEKDLLGYRDLLGGRGRLALLAELKNRGIAKLSERQYLANALGRALREGTFGVEVSDNTQIKGETWDFDPYEYAEKLVPASRALEGSPTRPVSLGVLGEHRVLGSSLLPPWPSECRRALFAAGCFWGLEKGFWRLPGVHSTAAGYACGHTAHPTYSEVCTGLTGHTEAVQVVYDPARIAFADLLRWFWEAHDPTQGMGQGADCGTQYRGAIVTFDAEQHAQATASRDAYQAALASSGRFFTSARVITVEIPPPPPQGTSISFYYAEELHQQYLARPDCTSYCTAQPLLISLPPFETWAPNALHSSEHSPKLPERFGAKFAPVEHCALRTPNEPIRGF